jgi:hypothetical protein
MKVCIDCGREIKGRNVRCELCKKKHKSEKVKKYHKTNISLGIKFGKDEKPLYYKSSRGDKLRRDDWETITNLDLEDIEGYISIQKHHIKELDFNDKDYIWKKKRHQTAIKGAIAWKEYLQIKEKHNNKLGNTTISISGSQTENEIELQGQGGAHDIAFDEDESEDEDATDIYKLKDGSKSLNENNKEQPIFKEKSKFTPVDTFDKSYRKNDDNWMPIWDREVRQDSMDGRCLSPSDVRDEIKYRKPKRKNFKY